MRNAFTRVEQTRLADVTVAREHGCGGGGMYGAHLEGALIEQKDENGEKDWGKAAKRGMNGSMPYDGEAKKAPFPLDFDVAVAGDQG